MVTEITKLFALIFWFQGLTVDLSIQISIRSCLVSHEEQIFQSKIEDATKAIERILFADSALYSGRVDILTSKYKRSLPNGQFLDQ